MTLKLVQVDAFTSVPFAGNPAAVCMLDREMDDAWMQKVAREMNLSETAFVLPRSEGDGYALRWFTPTVEVALCGHATLASAHVLWEDGGLAAREQARFHTKSGLLTADRTPGGIELDFPATPPEPAEPPGDLLSALGVSAARYVGRSRFDYLIEIESADAVRALAPDFGRIHALPVRGVIVTARGDGGFDCVSRFFAPAAGVDEDPVTGSAHCCLGPHWAARTGKDELCCQQASARGGTLSVRLVGNRVRLGGQAVTVMRGELLC